MSNTLVCSAVIYSLLVGAAYSALAILGLLARWCVLDTKSSPLLYMLYLFYFRVEKCEPRFEWRRFSIINDVDVIMPYETWAVKRTFIITLVYLALNVTLIAFALLAWCGRKSSVSRRFTVPLVFILILSVVFDVLATVYYVIDFTAVMKDDGLMKLLEVQNMESVRPDFERLPHTARWVSPLIMFSVTSKLFIFLIFNIIWAVMIIYKKFGKTKSASQNSINESKASQATTMTANDNLAYEHEEPKNSTASGADRYNDTARVKDFIYPHQLYSKSKKQKLNERLDDDWGDSKTDDDDFKIQRPVLTAAQYKNYRPTNLQIIPGMDKDIEHRLSRFHKSNGNLDHDEMDVGISYKEMRLRPTPPPKPNRQEVHLKPATSYYLNSTGHEDTSITYRPVSVLSDSRTDRSSGHVKTPQELRSQLPWSYFKTGDEVPRHALVHSDENDIPGTPLPDYDVDEVTKKNSRNF